MFFITLYFGRRGRENQRQLTKSSLKLSKTPNSGLEYYELNREAPGGVFSTKNHQGGLDGSDDPSDGKMFKSKGLAHCPVAVVEAYLSHLNPKCEALFQEPLSSAKFNPSSDVIWYSTVPLGHNTAATCWRICPYELVSTLRLPITVLGRPPSIFCRRGTWKIAISELSRAIKAMQAWNCTTIVRRSSSFRTCPQQWQSSSIWANLKSLFARYWHQWILPVRQQD